MTEAQIAAWNASFPIGTPVRFFPWPGLVSNAIDSEIASVAWSTKIDRCGVVKLKDWSKAFEIQHIVKRDWTMTDAAPEPILQFFAYEHLPEKLQTVSKPFGDMAKWIVETLPKCAERTAGLRKLLEAKDCAVRANLTKIPQA